MNEALDLDAAAVRWRDSAPIDDRKLAARLRRLAGKAIAEYGMIGAGDRVMVCVSGGKD